MPQRPQITISIIYPDQTASQTLVLSLSPDHTLADLKGLVQKRTGIAADAQHFFYNGAPFVSDQKLEQAGIKDDEMLTITVQRHGRSSRPQALLPSRHYSRDEIETSRLRILADPDALLHLQSQRPNLAASVNDPNRWREEWLGMEMMAEARQREHQHQLDLLNADPFNTEAQAKIEEMIRQERVMENLQHAYEHNPEVFGCVTMLYINCEVNGQPIKAFVDSGAQATIMSPDCAKACGIMRLIDNRYAGMAVGVGTAKVLGRVHHAEITIGSVVMPCAFTVMEGKSVDLLFGLDMLKRYKAKIDLEQNCLCFQGIQVPFLPESDIPKSFEQAQRDEPTVAGPNGTEVGTKSGVVRPARSVRPAGESSSAAGAYASHDHGHAQQTGVSDIPYPISDIEQLVNLGFSKEQAINALRACGGNVEYAASLLFQG